MTRKEKAMLNFKNGYACSQALVSAFSDLVKIDENEILKISLPFGGGIGRLRLTCGAFSGIAIIIGALFSENEVTSDNKMNIYSMIQELANRFEKINKSLCCADLLKIACVNIDVGGAPEERSESYYHHRPCEIIVGNAAQILEDFLIEKGIL